MPEPADKPPRKHLHGQLYVRAPNGVMLRDRQVTRLMVKVRKRMPWLQESDWPAVRGWARLEVLITQAYAMLRMQYPFDDMGEPRRLLKDVRQLLIAQLQYEIQLGMTPASRMAISANGTNAALDAIEAAERRLEAFNATDAARATFTASASTDSVQDAENAASLTAPQPPSVLGDESDGE